MITQKLQRSSLTFFKNSLSFLRSAHTAAGVPADQFGGPTQTVDQEIDPSQVVQLDEKCIVVDEQDNELGDATKRDCHLNSDTNKAKLHRAFSVFLFNRQNELMLQKRADTKITFPGMWTNSCCSHPLWEKGEREIPDNIGSRRAARRRLNYELGIPLKSIPLEAFHFITKIRYQATNIPPRTQWCENEMDHVLFIQREIDFKPNKTEVSDVVFIEKDELKLALDAGADHSKLPGSLKDCDQIHFTPWFRHIAKELLFDWWDNIDNIESIQTKHANKTYEMK